MAFNFDASGIGQFAIRLGLVTEDQVRECLFELDSKTAPAEDMIRLDAVSDTLHKALDAARA